jgi:L-gulonate 5-dehydrogenase
LLVDRVPSRLDIGQTIGAEALTAGEGEDPAEAIREWAGGDGPEVVFEATGVPAVARTAIDLVAQAGRVVIVGLSHTDAPIRVGDLAFREIDVLGVSCCQGEEFAEAVSLVSSRRDALASLVTHEFSFEQAPEAIRYAMQHPSEVMKAIVRVEAG